MQTGLFRGSCLRRGNQRSDELFAVVHPTGRFTANFTLVLDCTVEGRSGTLTLEAEDSGQAISETEAVFAGRAVITRATGDLAGLHGVLDIEGTVDLTTGLSRYGYAGELRFTR